MEIKGIVQTKERIAAVLQPQPPIVGKFGFAVREIQRDRRQFEIVFTQDKFEQDIKQFRIVIPRDTHKLGSNYAVKKIVRTDNGKDSNIWVQFEMLVNGDFVIYSDEKFDGKIVLEEV